MKTTIYALALLFAVALAQSSDHIQDPVGDGCLVLFDVFHPEDVDMASNLGFSCVPDMAMQRRCLVPRGATFTLDQSMCGNGAKLSLLDSAVAAPAFPIAWLTGEVPEGGVELTCVESGLEAEYLGSSLNRVEWIDCREYPEGTDVVPLDRQALGFTADLFNPKDQGHCLVTMNVIEPQDVDMGATLGLECNPNLAAIPVCRVPMDTSIQITRTLCSATLFVMDVTEPRSYVNGPVPETGLELTCTETGLTGDFLGLQRKKIEWVGCGVYPEEE